MSPNQIRQFTRIARAIEYLYDHAAEQPDLAQVAAAVHVSPEHLQREFSAWAGISPKKMLQHISISRAKAALKNSESVAEAAHSGGLSGTGRLHDLFVGIEKMTPGEYKNGGAGLQINYSLIPGPFGDLLAAATDKGICFMRFSDDPSAALNELRAEYPNARLIGQETAFHRQAADIFRTRHGRVTLHIKGTPFQLKVWQALLDIPAGSLQNLFDRQRANPCRAPRQANRHRLRRRGVRAHPVRHHGARRSRPPPQRRPIAAAARRTFVGHVPAHD